MIKIGVVMVEHVIFYWIMWAAWIVAAFFMKKSTGRTIISLIILLCIGLVDLFIEFDSFYIRAAFLLIISTGYYLAAKNERKVYFFLSVMALTSAYAGIHLFEIYDPVWFLIDRSAVITGLLGMLSIYLGKSMAERLGIFILSMSQGEFLFWVILGKFHQGLTIGTSDYLNMAAAGFAIICVWTYLGSTTAAFNQHVQKSAKGNGA